MILADKIIENRKKNGWSQEELADRLGVSRQSVSKWESAQSMPDMKKILQLSEVFDVSTDYLLRDEIEEMEAAGTVPVDKGVLEEEVCSVSMEEADTFLTYNESAAKRISTGVMLCIMSPILMIVLAGLAEVGYVSLSTDVAGIMGLVILLGMVTAAVAIFVSCGLRGKPYEYLEKESIETEYGVRGMVKDRMASYSDTHNRLLILGIMLCIISVIPLFMLMAIFHNHNEAAAGAVGVGILLLLCAVGVKIIVLTCIRQGGMSKLLEEGDYTRINKKISKYDGIYWGIVTAVYLAWSFISQRWDFTWLVWPVAGVLYAAYREIMKLLINK